MKSLIVLLSLLLLSCSNYPTTENNLISDFHSSRRSLPNDAEIVRKAKLIESFPLQRNALIKHFSLYPHGKAYQTDYKKGYVYFTENWGLNRSYILSAQGLVFTGSKPTKPIWIDSVRPSEKDVFYKVSITNSTGKLIFSNGLEAEQDASP